MDKIVITTKQAIDINYEIAKYTSASKSFKNSGNDELAAFSAGMAEAYTQILNNSKIQDGNRGISNRPRDSKGKKVVKKPRKA